MRGWEFEKWRCLRAGPDWPISGLTVRSSSTAGRCLHRDLLASCVCKLVSREIVRKYRKRMANSARADPFCVGPARWHRHFGRPTAC